MVRGFVWNTHKLNNFSYLVNVCWQHPSPWLTISRVQLDPWQLCSKALAELVMAVVIHIRFPTICFTDTPYISYFLQLWKCRMCVDGFIETIDSTVSQHKMIPHNNWIYQIHQQHNLPKYFFCGQIGSKNIIGLPLISLMGNCCGECCKGAPSRLCKASSLNWWPCMFCRVIGHRISVKLG